MLTAALRWFSAVPAWYGCWSEPEARYASGAWQDGMLHHWHQSLRPVFMALKLTSRQECLCIGREQAHSVRDFAAMVDSTWGRSGVHDARVALLRLLLQVSTASAALNKDQPHGAVQHCRPVSPTPQVCTSFTIPLAPGGRRSAGRVGSAGGSLGTRRSEPPRHP